MSVTCAGPLFLQTTNGCWWLPHLLLQQAGLSVLLLFILHVFFANCTSPSAKQLVDCRRDTIFLFSLQARWLAMQEGRASGVCHDLASRCRPGACPGCTTRKSLTYHPKKIKGFELSFPGYSA